MKTLTVVIIIVLCAASAMASHRTEVSEAVVKSGGSIDTARYYVAQVDTVKFEKIGKSWQPITDTLYRPKVQVWLTPEQLKNLLALLQPVRFDRVGWGFTPATLQGVAESVHSVLLRELDSANQGFIDTLEIDGARIIADSAWHQ